MARVVGGLVAGTGLPPDLVDLGVTEAMLAPGRCRAPAGSPAKKVGSA
jgi:hypothetical protein